jgi:hypothetical protein
MSIETGPEALSASYSVGTSRDEALTTHPLLKPRLKEE